ncbi:MAG: hypothetical protein CMD62_05950 [Gammaproteobacteria bacterium]|nr:hypothetical protein [Gammaproteobacteria bacterium]|tara:strand:- start:212 stop:904 length:693 start_codon:yes stop_codon:yes gene_type:complete
MSKKKTTVVAMSQTNIDRLAKTESEFQKLKGERADAYNSIQEKKLDQYATLTSHIKVIFNDNKTDSDNLPRHVGIQIREDLMNDVGMSKANAKMLYENTVKFVAKFDKDIPSQATPESVLEVFSSMDISTQNDLKKKVSKQVDDNIGDVLSRKLFGKWKTEKIKKDDGTVEEKEVYVPSKYTAQEIQNAWEVLQDAKRERDEFDKSCSNATKNAKDSNDIISRLDEALAS